MEGCVQALGDRAVTVTFGSEVTEAAVRAVDALRRSLERWPLAGMEEMVPSYTSLTVFYDPDMVAVARSAQGFPTVSEWVSEALRDRLGRWKGEDGDGEGSVLEIPVCYEGACAPDIGFVSVHTGMSVEEVIGLHLGSTYRVYLIGFVPGFPYMGLTDRRLAVPRRAEPRLRVAPGSVGLAGRQTGIYPLETPGGWQLIGRTPVRLFDMGGDPPCLLRAGMRVRFRRIGMEEYETLSASWGCGS